MATPATDHDPRHGEAAPTLILAGVLALLLIVAMLQRPAGFDTLIATEPIRYRIDINTAGRDELCLLPDVGPATAQKIIHHRQTAGPFTTPAELEQVSGIGPKTRAAIQPWVGFGQAIE